MLLALKLVLVPGLVASVSLAGRRWGPRVGGVLAGLPLVAVTTSLAAWLGPEPSGVIAPFPIASSVLMAFSHAQQGADVVLRFPWGLLPSMGSVMG